MSVGGAVAAVVDTIQQARPTVVDVQMFADIVTAAVREGVSAEITAARIEQHAPMVGPVGRRLQANQGPLALLALVATVVVGMVQIEQEADKEPAVKQPPAQVEVACRSSAAREVRYSRLPRPFLRRTARVVCGRLAGLSQWLNLTIGNPQEDRP